jgi:hypothetical protein
LETRIATDFGLAQVIAESFVSAAGNWIIVEAVTNLKLKGDGIAIGINLKVDDPLPSCQWRTLN